MKIADILAPLESWAPECYQESYDNAGLLAGSSNWELKGALLSLDLTEEVLQEAIDAGCNLIISHHPVVFKALKRLTGNHFVERILLRAIKEDIALYASHTNLDNMLLGVNDAIARRLGLAECRILAPREHSLQKLQTYVPDRDADRLREALFLAGAGSIGNYSGCSFNSQGVGTYLGSQQTHPYKGTPGVAHREPETKIEVVVPVHAASAVVRALLETHPYEEVAYELTCLENPHPGIGSGLIGELPEPMEPLEFLQFVRRQMQTDCVRHTRIPKGRIRKVAVCGGAGSFLLGAAKARKADAFLSADFKYHEFFEADNQILIADVGHYESEQFTVDIFYKILTEKIPNFAPLKSCVRTNPINYLF